MNHGGNNSSMVLPFAVFGDHGITIVLLFIYPRFYGMLHSTNIDTHTYMITHRYEYTHVHPIPISTSKRLD
jgi:hypothetical protein